MSYAETTQARIFLTQPFSLSAAPGLWILTSDDASGYQTISFNSCSVPSIYLSSGISYWYHSGTDSCCSINWILCVGPSGGLPAFPWGANVPTYNELISYLRDNRQPGSCEGGGGGPMLNIYNSDGTLTGDRVVSLADKKLLFNSDTVGSQIVLSKQTVFPPTSGVDVAMFLEPNDFVGSMKPAVGMGYVEDASINDSASFLASGVSGQKSAMMISVSNTGPINNLVQVNNGGVTILANTNTDSSGIEVKSTGVTLDGGTFQDVRIDNIPNNPVEPNVIHYNPILKTLAYGECQNIYTTNGQLAIVGGTRTVDVNGNKLFIADTGVGGSFDVNVDSIQIIVPDIDINGSLIKWNAPTQDDTIDQVLVHHPISNEIHWRDAATIGGGASKSVFSVSCITGMTLTGPGVEQLPAGGSAFQVDTTRGNYDLSGGDLDLTTGFYTPSTTGEYSIMASIQFRSTVFQLSVSYWFYNDTDAVNLCVLSTNVNQGGLSTNHGGTLAFTATLEAGKRYCFKTSVHSATTITTRDSMFSINKV